MIPRRITRRFLLPTLILVGAACGLAAVAFHGAVESARELLIGTALAQTGSLRPLLVVVIPTGVAMLLAGFMRRFAPSASGANLARVRRAYEGDPSVLDGRSVVATAALTPISLGSGAPLGPEGPMVVVASGMAMGIGRLVGLPKRAIRGMIPVGTAAGIAAVFNTPITGVVFAMEEVMGTASRGLLGGTLVAAVAGAVVQRMMLGGERILFAPTATWRDVRELIGFLAAGIIAGLVSGAALKLTIRLRKTFARAVRSSVLRAGIGGMLIGTIGVFVPVILSVGYPTTKLFLHGGGDAESAGIAFAAKVTAFIIALAAGLVGGTFAPALFIGAALGATIGHSAEFFLPGAFIDPAAYALVGMGAFFAGLLRCPISAVMIVFELTGDYALILPLMLAVAVSTSLSRRIAPRNMTELQMLDEGHVEKAAAGDPLAGLTVGEVMTREPLVIRSTTTLREAIDRIANTRHRTYPAVDEEGKLVGSLSGIAIATASRSGTLEQKVADLSEPPRFVARSHATLIETLEAMARAGVERCPVVDEDETVVGFLSPSDVLRARMGVEKDEIELM